MGLGDEAIARLAALVAGQVGASARRRGGGVEGRAKPAARGWGRWLGEPRAAVLVVPFPVVGAGGGGVVSSVSSARGGGGGGSCSRAGAGGRPSSDWRSPTSPSTTSRPRSPT